MTLAYQELVKQTSPLIIFYSELADVLEVAQLARPTDFSRGLLLLVCLYLNLSWLQSLWKMNCQILFLTLMHSMNTYSCTKNYTGAGRQEGWIQK